ncbi:GNAT family N-acetyltransferase [Nocardioides marinquilinus]|uniref:GNAT family N-acetyltransferase n=1 Tax=Nocardioides marinquilinus TaxID=1210400 RepID=A0ABP9PGV6_9ACTN
MIEVRPLDPDDDAQARAFWRVNRDAVADQPYHPYPPWEAARVFLREGRPQSVEVHLAAWDGQAMVGAGSAAGSTADNTDLARAEVAVVPDRRRAGIGSAVLDGLVTWAREHGRTTLTSEVLAPLDAEGPGALFARRHGFEVDLVDAFKVADLHATQGQWEALAAETAPHHVDYRVVTAWGPLPDHLAAGYCALSNRFYELAPSGEVERAAETWDLARLRARDERNRRAGRLELVSLALAADDEVVALTEIVCDGADAGHAYQGATIVEPGYRGHRLGLALKLANHRALLDRLPGTAWIATGNADVNAAMNAINDRLGFRVVARGLELARRL